MRSFSMKDQSLHTSTPEEFYRIQYSMSNTPLIALRFSMTLSVLACELLNTFII